LKPGEPAAVRAGTEANAAAAERMEGAVATADAAGAAAAGADVAHGPARALSTAHVGLALFGVATLLLLLGYVVVYLRRGIQYDPKAQRLRFHGRCRSAPVRTWRGLARDPMTWTS